MLHRVSASFILVFLSFFLFFFSLVGQSVLVRLLHPGGRIHMHHKNRHKYYTDTVLHWPTLNIYIASRHRLSLHRKYIYVLFGLLIYMVANMAHWTFIGQIRRDRLKLHNPFLGRLDAYTSELSMSFRPSLLGLYYNPRCCWPPGPPVIIPASSDAIGQELYITADCCIHISLFFSALILLSGCCCCCCCWPGSPK